MKNIRLSLVAAAMILGSFITAKAQTADEIVQKHLAAIGGEDNWKKINSIKMTGSMNAGGTELPITITTVSGKGYRMEFTMNGMNNYMILTPTKGWMFFPVQGQQKAEAVPDEMVKESQDQLDPSMNPLVDYKAKGNTVAYMGKDNVDGTDCFKLKITYKGGKEETMFLDASNYYFIRSVEKTKANGKEQESTSNFSNYQKLPEGILFPMSIESDGGPITLKTVEINKPVDESIFMPADDSKK